MYLAIVKTLAPLLLLFMTEECLDTIFIKLNILHAPCLKLILSKALGYGIVAGSVMVKFPQILKIHKSASVVGLSLTTFALEAFCAMTVCTYNFAQGFPFSTWGENFFILLQLIVLIAQYFHYTNNKQLMLLTPILVPVVSYAMTHLPKDVLALGITASIPLLALSKILQIKANFMNGHTGQLSFLTSLLNFLGILARLFTVIQEVDDQLILINAGSVFVLNTIIIVQFLAYWNVDPAKQKTQ